MTDETTAEEVLVVAVDLPQPNEEMKGHGFSQDDSLIMEEQNLSKEDISDVSDGQEDNVLVNEIESDSERHSSEFIQGIDDKLTDETPNASGDSVSNFSHLTDLGEMKNNLIVNYLPSNMTQDEVRALFSSIGEVESCKLVRDKVTGESLGYAFVKFANHLDGERAVNTLNKLRLQSKTIKVSFARPSSESIKNANLYICGLPKKMNLVELEALFSQCGKIITARILYDKKTGLQRGVAFIRFDQRHEAEAAIAKFDGVRPENGTEALKVKFAKSPVAVTTKQDATPQNLSNVLSPSAQLASANPVNQNLLYPLQQLSNALSRIRYTASTPVSGLDMIGNNPLLTQAMVAASGGLTNKGWCLFVCNLSPETIEAEMWKLFGPFGAVQSVKLIRDPQTKRCKGFGFVTMTNYEEAMYAVLSLDDFEHNNRRLQVSFKTEGSPKLLSNIPKSLLAYQLKL